MDTLNPRHELTALVNLLDEPDETAFSKVREKLFYFGKEALPFLEHARDDVFDSRIQERIDHIIHRIYLEEIISGESYKFLPISLKKEINKLKNN